MGLVMLLVAFVLFYFAFRVWSIDSRIFSALGPPVHLWSKWTGKSNFALARVLVILLVASLLILSLIYISNGKIAHAIVNVILVVFVATWALFPIGPIHRIEKLINESDGEALPVILLSLERSNRSFRLISFSLLLWSAWSMSWGFVIFWTVDILISYVLFHYNAGGRSKLKEKIKDLVSPPKELAPVQVPTRR